MTSAKSVEFVLTSGELFADSQRRCNWKFDRLIITAFLILILYMQWVMGFSLILAIASVYFVLEFMFPHFLVRVIVAWYVSRKMQTFKITWDDDEITVTSSGATVRFPWQSIAESGIAEEYQSYFEIKNGTAGVVRILKRAFVSDDDVDDFRFFVAEKLGDRCRFSTHNESSTAAS